MNYTINKLANLAGVTVRTLHYYDEIGLLHPAYLADNGYRYYGEKELLKLQQILFFRELDFPLEKIKEMAKSPNYHALTALADQKELLKLKKKRLEKLLTLIDKTMKDLQQKNQIKNPKELYDPFKDQEYLKHKREVEERWGSSEAYKQSMQRVKQLTKIQMEKLKADGKKFNQELANSMDKGIEHEDTQALIEKHYQGIKFFYDCSLEMYRNLGNMYVEDLRFSAMYEGFRPGLARFIQAAINYYCKVHKK
jgi:DNA-binding transcriptional MerR regulator